MLDRLLTWSLTQTGDIKIEPVPVNLTVIIKEVLKVHEDAMFSKEITCNFDEPSFSATVTTDTNACFTIFHNIISNAVKFSYKSGLITLGMLRCDKHLRVTITDNGTGMPQEKIESILTSSVNISSKGTANEKGTGVGLATSFYMAKCINASIDISSSSSGTSVNISLPV
jgi:signal transduction histidine kinase